MEFNRKGKVLSISCFFVLMSIATLQFGFAYYTWLTLQEFKESLTSISGDQESLENRLNSDSLEGYLTKMRDAAIAMSDLTDSMRLVQSNLQSINDKSSSIVVTLNQVQEELAANVELSTVEDSKKAFALANQMLSEDRMNDATSCLVNALTKSPGNTTYISEYKRVMQSIAQKAEQDGKLSDATFTLERLVSLLKSQVAYVKAEDITPLLRDIAEVSNSYQALITKESTDYPANTNDNLDAELLASYETLKQGALDFTIPDDPEVARSRLQAMQKLLDYALSEESVSVAIDISNKLESYVKCLESTVAFDSLMKQGHDLVGKAKAEENSATAAYFLQMSEGALRQCLALKDEVTEARSSQVPQLLSELDSLSRVLSEREVKRNSEDIWNEFMNSEANKERWNSIQAWASKPEVAGAPSAYCQQQIDQIYAYMKSLEVLLPQLEDRAVAELARQHVEDINVHLKEARSQQQKEYQLWAMGSIQRCLETGLASKGWANDSEIGIAEAIVVNLGPIDRNLLTIDVGRCYSEVFETLFAELKEPSGTADFDSLDGFKLNVLKRLENSERKSLEEF